MFVTHIISIPTAVESTRKAQCHARGLLFPPDTNSKLDFSSWTPAWCGNSELSAKEWEDKAMTDVSAGTAQMGNHICWPSTCYKQRKNLHRKKFCRMLYWHYNEEFNRKGILGLKRRHGLPLQERWDGTDLQFVCQVFPHRGLPALEVTFPFHFKLCAGILLGPRCNHDLGFTFRLPIATLTARDTYSSSDVLASSGNDLTKYNLDELIDARVPIAWITVQRTSLILKDC